MRGSSKRILSLLIAAIFFVVALVVYSNLVLPEYAAVNTLRAEYASKSLALEEQKTILETVNARFVQYKGISSLNDTLNRILPTSENVAGAFGQIFAIARSSGLSIQQFGVNTTLGLRPSKKNAGPALRNIGTVQLNVHVVGSYEALKKFVQTVERNERIMDLTDLKVQPLGRGDVYLFNVVINAYYQA